MNKPLEPWKPDICIYHGNCDDGFAAAWAVWRKWGNEVRYVPAVYGKPLDLHNWHGQDILFVDYSLPRAELDALVSPDFDRPGARSIVILDHHKTAQAALEPFAIKLDLKYLGVDEVPGLLSDLDIHLHRPPIIAAFDMDSSGAWLAWAFCHGIERNGVPPNLIALVQDRDLWRFAFGEKTRQFSAALRTYPMDFDVWTKIAGNTDALIEEGAVILRAHRANIEKFLADAFEEEIGGHHVPCVNVPYHYASDAAHELLAKHPKAPFAAAWFKRGDGQIQYSLRSEDARIDVSEIAKGYGGGGHRNAAGFQKAAA